MADELETQETKSEEGQEPKEEETKQVETEQEAGQKEAGKEEPKTYPEDYVKGLRRENAKYRRKVREMEQADSQQKIPVDQFGRPIDPRTGQPIVNQPNTGQPQMYDPRVDDILLANKLNDMKADPYLKELFNETDEEGRTFEEKLLETAIEKRVSIDDLDSLAWKMEKEKILGKVKQSGVDEAYESMKEKKEGSAEKGTPSGKGAGEGEVKTVEDAINKAMKEKGVTRLSDLG